MKTILLFVFFFALANGLLGEDFIIIGWNDLGMHCSNKHFSYIAILPPYNNLTAQVIKKGDQTHSPQIMTTGFKTTYEIPGNTYSVGKTNFWSYEDKLFGVNLADNIGLTGNGLTGEMAMFTDYFQADGIPITPYTDLDLVNEAPYQLALLKLYDLSETLLSTTQCVIPVSNEINCVSSGCHSSELDILNEHEDEEEGGIDPAKRPYLCASCHASFALGMAGKAGLPSLSYVVHEKHKSKTSDCYKCHPGTQTKCLRDVMFSSGLTCQTCHGSLTNVAESIAQGRRPWQDEPQCGATACHGANYAENPGKLYRLSRGHANLYCSACHGSPHAILPTVIANDNIQNTSLQGNAGTLADCKVCHGYNPSGSGPHNITVPIELSSFSAALHNQSVELQWTCTHIYNVYGFEIQSSDDGINFTKIGFVKNNFNEKQHYTFIDTDITHSKLLFYKLLIIENNGVVTYSATLSIKNVLPDNIYLSNNYPNPFNSSTRIQFTLPQRQQVQLQVYNSTGALVRTLADNTLDAGVYEYSWNGLNDYGHSLASGFYLCKLTTLTTSLTKKMSLVK